MAEKFIMNLTEQKQEIKTILSLTRCVYTLQGVSALCGMHRHLHIKSLADFSRIDSIALMRGADLLIVDSDMLNDEMSNLFNAMASRFNHMILLANNYSGGQRSVEAIAGAPVVVDKSSSLTVLRLLLEQALNAPSNKVKRPMYNRARTNERQVLCALLNGDTPSAIAAKMGITYAAVSRYKMIALRRAGAKSLNEVLAGNYHSLFKE